MATAFPCDEDDKTLRMNENEFDEYLKKEFSSLPKTSYSRNSSRNPNNDDDDDRYRFNNLHRGLALIFNIEKDRKGSPKDASALKESLEGLGFHVKVFVNLFAHQMLRTAQVAAVEYQHENADCFMCVVLAHGSELFSIRKDEGIKSFQYAVSGYDDRIVTIQRLVRYFRDEECPQLEGKPKLFFIQTCRGDRCDHGTRLAIPIPKDQTRLQQENPDSSNDLALDPSESVAKPSACCAEQNKPKSKSIRDAKYQPHVEKDMPTMQVPRDNTLTTVKKYPSLTEKDFLIGYSTPPGYCSWRNTEDGSWYIQELCKYLRSESIGQVSFIRVLTRVSRKVALHYMEMENGEECKEMPVIESKLTKDIFINHCIL